MEKPNKIPCEESLTVRTMDIELKSICWKLDAYAEADEKQIVYMAN